MSDTETATSTVVSMLSYIDEIDAREMAEYVINHIEQQKEAIAELEKDIAFLQCCINSGETAKVSDRPSQRAKYKESSDENS